MQPRWYQREAIDHMWEAWKQRKKRVVIALPPAAGKTVIFTKFAQEFNGRVLAVAHRDFLLTQMQEKFKQVWPEAKVGLFNGEFDEWDCDVVCASVQSLLNRKRIAKLGSFDLCVIDEAHHWPAASYVKVLNNVDAPFSVGVTGSPMRGDGVYMPNVFGPVVYTVPTVRLIQEGFLNDVQELPLHRYRNVQTIVDDVNAAAKVKGERIVVFSESVDIALESAKRLNHLGVKSATVWGDMENEVGIDRKDVLREFRTDGGTQVLFNVNLLTEGWDFPSLRYVFIARGCRSIPMMAQMVGRILRTEPGKERSFVFRYQEPGERTLDTADGFLGHVPAVVRRGMQDGKSVRQALEAG